MSTAEQVREKHAARAAYDARLPNLVSVRMAEEAARREYTSVDGGKSIISTFLCFSSCCTHTYPSKHIDVDSGKYRGRVRLCGVMGWAGGLEYAARGHEQPAGAPRQPHFAPQHTFSPLLLLYTFIYITSIYIYTYIYLYFQ